MDVTTAIATILKREGVRYLFGFPSNPLFDTGIAEEMGIRTIITRQERTAVHMADAIGRLTGGDEIVAFACQHGPGTQNSIGAVAQAFGESAPLVAIPAGYDRAKTDVDPKFNSLINYQQVTKTAEQLNDPDAVVETIRRAFHAARNGRQRPALVEVPMEVWDMEVGEFDDLRSAIRSGEVDIIVSRNREALEVAVEEDVTYFSTHASARATLAGPRHPDDPIAAQATSARPRRTRDWGGE